MKIKKTSQFKQSLLLFSGYFIIYRAFNIFGETEIWSWQMWVKILVVSIGGSTLIQYGKNRANTV